MGETSTKAAKDLRSDWVNGNLARTVLREKFATSILVVLHQRGPTSTTGLVRAVHGHPEAVIRALRILERAGAITRTRNGEGRHPVESRLTVRGFGLVETPVHHWDRVLRKWHRVSD